MRFAEGTEDQQLHPRTAGYGLTVPALPHLASLYFQPPIGAPARFRDSGSNADEPIADAEPHATLAHITRTIDRLTQVLNLLDPDHQVHHR